jgi:hypothetical protein
MQFSPDLNYTRGYHSSFIGNAGGTTNNIYWAQSRNHNNSMINKGASVTTGNNYYPLKYLNDFAATLQLPTITPSQL